MAGVQQVCLNNLNSNLQNALLIGLIIAKGNPRIFKQQKKNSETRGVTFLTLRDSAVDVINCDIWGSEYFIMTIYERFLVGDVVEVTCPKIFVKQSDKNDIFRPHVSSPFYLSVNEGQSEISAHTGELYFSLQPLLHLPTKACAAYCGLADIIKMTGECQENAFVDLLVCVKSVNPPKNIKTKAGVDMSVRSIELMDNTTPATIDFNVFDSDTIHRAKEWRSLETVLFIADARISWRGRGCGVNAVGRTVVTVDPHTADAESLRLYARNLADTRGGLAAMWASWGGEGGSAASVRQVRDRLWPTAAAAAAGAAAAAAPMQPFCATLHAMLTALDLSQLAATATAQYEESGVIKIKMADHTGEIALNMPLEVLELPLERKVSELREMSCEQLDALRWQLLLEQCVARVAARPPTLTVLSIRKARAQDPIPLY